MRETGATLEQISNKFKISSERVRQILTREPNFCIKHSKAFSDTCKLCILEAEYKTRLSKMNQNTIINETARIPTTGRDNEIVLKRRIITRVLKDRYKYSFKGIGRLLKRDHTSIMSLYYNG